MANKRKIITISHGSAGDSFFNVTFLWGPIKNWYYKSKWQSIDFTSIMFKTMLKFYVLASEHYHTLSKWKNFLLHLWHFSNKHFWFTFGFFPKKTLPLLIMFSRVYNLLYHLFSYVLIIKHKPTNLTISSILLSLVHV